MTRDERACAKATKEYLRIVEKYGLDDIVDEWGSSNKRYMKDAFISGFYAGRDYKEEETSNEEI